MSLYKLEVRTSPFRVFYGRDLAQITTAMQQLHKEFAGTGIEERLEGIDYTKLVSVEKEEICFDLGGSDFRRRYVLFKQEGVVFTISAGSLHLFQSYQRQLRSGDLYHENVAQFPVSNGCPFWDFIPRDIAQKVAHAEISQFLETNKRFIQQRMRALSVSDRILMK